MLIRNIYVYAKNKSSRELKTIYVSHEGWTDIRDIDQERLNKCLPVIDAGANHTLMPGMLDTHIHGYGGPDFAEIGDEPHKLPIITQALGSTGLSYAMATFVSLALPTLIKSLRVLDDYVVEQAKNPTEGATKIVGVHLEGPFIAKNCKGAHAESALQTRIDMLIVRQILLAAPHITEWKMTLAPDLPGADTFINEVKALEKENIFVKIFIGHTHPDKYIVEQAIAAGAAGFTHLGNACGETCSRVNGPLEKHHAQSHVVQWVLENPEKCPAGVELIVDGVHLSRSFVRLIKKTLGDKIVLVTDALGPSGLEDGLYQLGTLTIRKEENIFYLANSQGEFIMKEGIQADGTKGKVKLLSGSAASFAFCVQNYLAWIKEPDQTEEDRMDSIYMAIITNPRMTALSLSAIKNLPDEKNFVIFNMAGELCLSLCNSRLMFHKWQRCK